MRRVQRAPRRAFAAVALSVLAGTTVSISGADAQVATSATISTAGPLTSITISDDLNCDVRHASDTSPEFYGMTACATLAVVNGTLYGPLDIPAGGAAGPRTTYTPVSQSAPSGTGTNADPYRIVTIVDAGTSGVRLTQTDTYVTGAESYRTDVAITRTTAIPDTTVRLYRAGDCFLQNNDQGYGTVDSTTGAVACTTSVTPGSRIIQFLPITSGSHYIEDLYGTVWSTIGTQSVFPNSCQCSSLLDNGAGLNWDVAVPSTGSAVVSSLITFSPTGVTPLTTSKVADAGTSVSGTTNGYTITVHNPNAGSAVLDSIFDDLPAGFASVPGSTTGLTTANPSVDPETGRLTWNGPFAVPGEQSVSLHFGVTVASTSGTYTNEAGGSSSATVAPTGPTAAIVVTAPALTLTKSDEPDPVTSGSDVRYTMTIGNTGAAAASGVTLVDTLPAHTTFVSSSPSQGTCAPPSGGAVTCAVGTIAGGASAQVKIVLATATNFVGTITNHASVTSTQQPTPVVADEPTQVVAPTAGAAAGYVPPGGSLSTGQTASPQQNTVATFSLPNTGFGAPIVILQTSGATYCEGPCTGQSVTVSTFAGYNDPKHPAKLLIRWDRTVFGRGLKSKTYVLKEGQTVPALVPECADDPSWSKAEKFVHTLLRLVGLGPWGTRAVPSPCVNKRFINADGDLSIEILYLSGDPSFGRR